MANLLDQASIILTPTAYDNGKVLCVKPSAAPYGDFDFSRNSSATRVNAQGLVEDVQILSGELVTNGDFSNGSTDWTLGTGWSIGTDKAIYDGSGGTSQIFQSGIATVGSKYKLTLDVLANEGSGINSIFLGNDLVNDVHLDVGSYTFYATVISGSSLNIYGRTNETFEISNISLIEITDDTNLPRINYDNFSYDGSGAIIPNSGCGSWLFEPQSTNLITYSELFSGAYWSKTSNVTITNDFAISPDGTLNASNWVSVGGSYPQMGRTISGLTIGETYTLSFYVKSDGTNQIIQSIGFTGFPKTTFTPTSKWTRITNTITATATSHSLLIFTNSPTASASSFLLWGAMLEAQSYSTSYIPTEGTTKTRNRDLCTNGGSAALINSTEGVLYFEGSTLANDGTNRYLSINDGTVSNYIYFRYVSTSNQVLMRTQVGGVTINTISTFLTDTTLNAKFALKWKSGDYAFWINGVEVGTDSSTTIFTANTLDLIEYSFPTDGGGGFPSKTKCLAVFPYLSDTELAELTTI